MRSMPARHPVWLVLLTVSLPMFMAALDNLVVTNALPAIRADLDATLEELTWTINAYTLSFASFILMASALADRFGRRRVFAIGVAVFTVASLACGLSSEASMLIAARAVQGLGAAAVLPLSLTLLSTSVPERLRPSSVTSIMAPHIPDGGVESALLTGSKSAAVTINSACTRQRRSVGRMHRTLKRARCFAVVLGHRCQNLPLFAAPT